MERTGNIAEKIMMDNFMGHMMKEKYYGIALAWLVTTLLLTACGGGGASTGATTPANAAPVANAGIIQNVVTATLVTLNGSASSDANGDPLTYSWTLSSKPAGSAATLTGSTSVAPTFTADVAGSYVVSLVVNDGKVNSAAATVTITATIANAAPVANAGTAQNVVTNTLVTLNGSASSDANGDPLTYSWTLTSRPIGSLAVLIGATSVAPTFTADVAGSYVASLVVNDGKVNSVAATVTITATIANAAPVANAGTAQNVLINTLVTLNGSASSDANGDPLTYSWTLTSKPVGSLAALTGATSIAPTFTADVAGTYVASLVVNDGKVNSTPAAVTITVINPGIYLSENTGMFNPNYTPVSFPYASSAMVTASLSGIPAPTTYKVAEFSMTAVGGNYTVQNLAAVDANGFVVPYFTGLSNGQTIANGSAVMFSLVSPLTGGRTANITYRFSILETGGTFNYTVQLRTN
ncbi:MAG: hypothetical protein HY016_00050 [Nitrosomonadales bacterium]|nr:hypothetical protein [Nitrosomonadales bacterium]